MRDRFYSRRNIKVPNIVFVLPIEATNILALNFLNI